MNKAIEKRYLDTFRRKWGIEDKQARALMAEGILMVKQTRAMTDQGIMAVPGIGPATLSKIRAGDR